MVIFFEKIYQYTTKYNKYYDEKYLDSFYVFKVIDFYYLNIIYND